MTDARRLRGGPLGTANGRVYTCSIFLVGSKLQHGIGTFIQGLFQKILQGGTKQKVGGGGGGGGGGRRLNTAWQCKSQKGGGGGGGGGQNFVVVH